MRIATVHRLLAAQFLSALAAGAILFSLSLWLYKTTGNPIWVAVLTAARVAPSIYLSLFTGHLVDRMERRLLMSITYAGSILAAGTMVLVLAAWPEWVIIVVLLVFLGALFESTSSLALSAMIPEYVRIGNYEKYNGVLSTIQYLPFIGAPLLGAALLETLPIHMVAGMSAVATIMAFILVITAKYGAIPAGKRKSKEVRGLLEGLRQIIAYPMLLRLQVLFSTNNMLNGLVAGILTAYLYARFNDPGTVASISVIAAVGAVLGGVSALAYRETRYRIVMMAVLVIAAAIVGRVAIPIVDAPVLLGSALLGRNLAFTLLNAINDGLWQQVVAKETLGRTFGARRLLGQGLYPLAVLSGGIVYGIVKDQAVWIGLKNSADLDVWAMNVVLVGAGLLEIGIGLTMMGLGMKYSREKRGYFHTSFIEQDVTEDMQDAGPGFPHPEPYISPRSAKEHVSSTMMK